MPEGQFVRLAEQDRPAITLYLDGRPIRALAGDTVLTALLTAGPLVRRSEFGDGPRASFCVMGACQDCWVFLETGARIRACTSMAADGMRLSLDGPPA